MSQLEAQRRLRRESDPVGDGALTEPFSLSPETRSVLELNGFVALHVGRSDGRGDGPHCVNLPTRGRSLISQASWFRPMLSGLRAVAAGRSGLAREVFSAEVERIVEVARPRAGSPCAVDLRLDDERGASSTGGPLRFACPCSAIRGL